MAKMPDTVDASAIEAAEAEYLAARAAALLSLNDNSHGADEEPTEELAQCAADELLRLQLCSRLTHGARDRQCPVRVESDRRRRGALCPT